MMLNKKDRDAIRNATEGAKARIALEAFRDEAKADARYEQVVANAPEWTTLEDSAVLRVLGSEIAALPTTGKKNARNFIVFNIKTRDVLCHLAKTEVYGWLTNHALDSK